MFAGHVSPAAAPRNIGMCHSSVYVDIYRYTVWLKGRWYDSQSRAWEPLHCQISACLRREDKDWTGVGEADRLCTRECPSLPPSLYVSPSLCLIYCS